MRIVTILLILLIIPAVTATTLLYTTETFEQGLNNAGYYAYTEGNNNMAEQLFLRAIDENPAYENARYNLATLLFEEERYEEAAVQLDALVALDEKNPQYHYDFAVNLVEPVRKNGGDTTPLVVALEHYETAEALAPGFAHATENIAILEAIFSI